MSVEINADSLEWAAAKLRHSSKEVKKVTRKAIGRIGRPIGREVLREGLEAGFPGHKGGLIDYLAKSRVQANPVSGFAGVRVVLGSRKNHQIGRMVRQGYVRHPVFGNKKVWANTAIPNPGAFEDAVNKRADEIKGAVVEAIQQVLDGAVK